MRVFFSIREFWLNLRHVEETELPLTPSTTSVTTEDLVDTSIYPINLYEFLFMFLQLTVILFPAKLW